MNELKKGYNTTKVKGYEKIRYNSKVLNDFLENFYKSWECPEEHTPIKVKFKQDKTNGTYLRVDCINGKWYHVKSACTWY